MSKQKLVNIILTPAEAVAIERIASAAVADVRSDPQTVSNEVTLLRAVDNVQRGLEKIRAAIASVE
ncbi:MAG: hypothetical protein WCJ64_06190 [Rhodospirillaceae bacterium]